MRSGYRPGAVRRALRGAPARAATAVAKGATKGTVYLVGAGPLDLELIPLRGFQLSRSRK